MTRWIQMSAIPLAGLAFACLMLLVIAWLRRPVAGRCPGPRTPLWQYLLPWNWLTLRRCWYDLSGLPRDSEGLCVCPECGTRTRGLRLRRRRIRWELVACLLSLASLACWKVRWIRYGGWIDWTPATVLLLAERYCGHWIPDTYTWRITSRLDGAKLNTWQRRQLVDVAIESLANDYVRWNADWGYSVLRRAGDDALPAVEAALDATDSQKRLFAADFLRQRCVAADPKWTGPQNLKPPYTPPDRLYAVTVESLGSCSGSYYYEYRCAYEPLTFLTRDRGRAEPFLRAGLTGDSDRQRFLCAVAAGFMRSAQYAPLAAPILIDHLSDNYSSGDARLAAAALHRLGFAAIPIIRNAIDPSDTPDYQKRDLLSLVLFDFEHPNAPEEARRRFNHVTTIVGDPATDIDLYWRGTDGLSLND